MNSLGTTQTSSNPDSAQQLSAIVRDSDDAIITKTAEGVITSFNPGAERMYGYAASEVLGKHLSILLPPDHADEFPAIMRRLLAGERIEHYETVRRRKDGTLIDVSVTISPLRDRTGRVIGASKVGRDITEQKRSARMREEHSRTLEMLNRTGTALTGELELERLIQTVTDAATALCGAEFGAFFYNITDERGESYSLYTVSGAPREAFAKFPMPRNTAVFGPTFAGEGIVRSDDITKDPRYGQNAPYRGMPPGHLPVRSYLALPVISRSGQVIGALFFGHAHAGVFTREHEQIITGVAAQAAVAIDNARLFGALRDREQELRIITDAMPALVSYIDADLRYRFNNKLYEEWFGVTNDEIRGKHVREVVGEDAYETLRPRFEAALAGEHISFEAAVAYRNRGLRTVRATYVPDTAADGSVKGLFVLVLDVTDTRRSEQALWTSELRLRQALEAGRMGAWEWDIGGQTVTWSAELELMHGVAPGTFPGTFEAFQADIHPDDRADVIDGINRSLIEGAEHHIEYRIVRPDGQTRWVEDRGQLFRTVDGRPDRIVGVCIDITERKQAEANLRRSEEQYRAAFELAAVGKAQVDPDTGRFLRVNRKLCEITGYSEQELLSMTFPQITHTDDRQVDFSEFQSLIAGDLVEHTVEKRYVRKGGETSWVSVNSAVVRDATGHALHAVSVIQEINDRKRAESELSIHRERLEELVMQRTSELEESHQRLRLSERMAALGTLSAGLGHDMGNLLLPLRLRLDSMETKGVPPQTREDLDAIRKCAEYLQRLANGLRLFALDPEGADSSGDSTDINEWWRDVQSFYKNALPRNVVLDRDFAEGVPLIGLPRSNLTQAVFNLVQNAGDALRGRDHGRVVVWAKAGHEPGTIKIGVTDNGPGMAAEVKRRCMEPFYTTKTRAISTGLGLALVHGIVQKAGGSIEIDSELGRGTTFVLTLPAVRWSSDETDPTAARPLAIVSLDDDRMRAYVGSVLDSLGFDVSWDHQPEGSAALLWITSHQSGVDELTREFIGNRRERRVVMFGRADAGNGSPEGIVQLEAAPKPAAIRQALRDIVDEIAQARASTKERFAS